MSDWKEFKYRSLWQHALWVAVQSANKKTVWTLEAEDALALVIKRELPFGLCWLEVPRGPLFKNQASYEAIMNKIQDLGQKEGAVFIRLSSYKKIEDTKLIPTKLDHHPETSLIIDLSQSEEEILEQMKQKGRYNIKLAEKHDVKVEASDDMDNFYHLLSKTGNRDGFGVHPKSYYSDMLKGLGEHGQLLLAYYEERVVAGGIFVYLDDWGIYYYGASDHHYRNVMAPYVVQWTAIKEAKKRGCAFYDFLGISPEGAVKHAWSGVTGFKKKFGGKLIDYPRAKDLVIKPFWYFLYKLRKRLA